MRFKVVGKFFLGTFALLLATVIFLSSCSGKKNNVVMEYRNSDGKVTSTVSESFMSFWIAVQKGASSDYLAYVDAVDGGWNTILDEEKGTTFSELFRDDCVRSLKNLMAVEYIHDYVCGIKFTDEQQKSVESRINEISTSFDSQKSFESEMQKYGAKTEDYEKYLVFMLKQSTLLNYFYGENGERAFTEETKRKYFEDNYAIIKHIFIDTRGITKDDGTTVSLTEEEKAQKSEYADEILGKIKDGTVSFEDAFAQYNEDAYASSHPNGYFVSNDGTYFADFTNAAFSLKDGEVTKVVTPSGIHIMKRCPMDKSLYASDDEVYSAVLEKLISSDFSELISSVSDGIYVDEEKIAELDASLIMSFTDF